MTKKAIKRMIFFIFCPFRYYRLSEDKINPSALRRAPLLLPRRGGVPQKALRSISEQSSLLLPKAKGMDEEVRGRLSGHGFSTEVSLLICGSKAAGVPRGMALLVAGRSPGRGGRERSDRWKGGSGG